MSHVVSMADSCRILDPAATGPQVVDLLLQSADTLYQVTELSRKHQENGEIRVFYSHLQLLFLRLRNGTSDALYLSNQVDDQFMNQALYYLSSFVPETYPQKQASAASNSQVSRLQALNLTWAEAEKEDEEARLALVSQWSRHNQISQQRLDASKALEHCADVLEGQHSRTSSREARLKTPIAVQHNEPSRLVWKTAQSLFDALIGCKVCPCHQSAAFGAKLELGTYRKPENRDAVAKRRRLLRTKGNVASGDRKTNDGLDLDMFVSLERDWHEFRVHSREERAVRFAHEEDNPEDTSRANVHYGRERVERLCKHIMKAKNKMYQRLLLQLASGHLFEVKFEKSDFSIDRTVSPISLSQGFRERPTLFTDKTKRILSLIIAFAVLHLHGTSWLQEGLVAEDIQFFQTVARKTPLRPFLQIKLDEQTIKFAESPDERAENAVSSGDDLDMGHQCMPLVDLAVILIELHFVSSFQDLARERDIEIVPRNRGRVYYCDVDQVFNGRFNEEGDMISEGWRSHIPEDSALLEAIDNCLDAELWETEDGERLGSESLKSRIYEKIVHPLESYLSLGFSEIPLDNIDRYARNVDFGRWGQALTSSNEARIQPFATEEVQFSKAGVVATYAAVLEQERRSGFAFTDQLRKSDQHLQADMHQLQTRSFPISCPQVKCATSRFYDDELSGGSNPDAEAERYLHWKREYQQVFDRFSWNRPREESHSRVKIAILDTGIDRDHYAFDAREDRIKGRLNCHNESQRSIPDTNGHGTFTASLVLDYAPDADLYIIKITDKENATPDATTVVKAIQHAVNTWNVDIISMSFGWPSSDFDGQHDLQMAIDHAFNKKILMFAAASNSGGRLGRAYPASCPQVICVHSTDTNGNVSRFSPTANPHSINIATVGECIESAWPTLLCGDEGGSSSSQYVKSKSGTSYATPILAGIAAFLLQYARSHLPEQAAECLKRKDRMEALLKRCAERGPDYQPRDGYYYVELSLNKHNLFGQDVEWINHEMLNTLRT